MGYCINCLFQGDNSLDANGNGRIFCMVKKKWMMENDSCEEFTEYADLNKEIRNKYAFEIREKKSGNNKISTVINQSFKVMVLVMLITFIMFVLIVKFFDKYIF